MLVKNGQYQVLEVLYESRGFRSCTCIDVESDNSYKQMILNIYETPGDIRRLLPDFYALCDIGCSDLIEVFPGEHSLWAVFAWHSGTKVSEYFAKLDINDFETRFFYAKALLKKLLALDMLQDSIAYMAFQTEHLVIQETRKKVHINFILPPHTHIFQGYKQRQAVDMLRSIFLPNRYVPNTVFSFINSIEQNEQQFSSIKDIYMNWKRMEERVMQEHQELRSESTVDYLKRIAKQAFPSKIRDKLPE